MLKIMLISIIILLSLIVICGIIYMITKGRCFKFLYHDIFGWHQPDANKDIYYNGCNCHATCKHCGKDIMQDSQGNWF